MTYTAYCFPYYYTNLIMPSFLQQPFDGRYP